MITWGLSERGHRMGDASQHGSVGQGWTGVTGINELALTIPDPNHAARSENPQQASPQRNPKDGRGGTPPAAPTKEQA